MMLILRLLNLKTNFLESSPSLSRRIVKAKPQPVRLQVIPQVLTRANIPQEPKTKEAGRTPERSWQAS
jgi:hypothetical protein